MAPRLVPVLIALAVVAVAAWALQDRSEPVAWIDGEHGHNHLHGIGYDGHRLFLATHHGLFVHEDGRLHHVGDARDDLMGFALHPTQPDTMVASGHPARGGNLGLVRSEDGGRSWRQVSAGADGETVDFHSLAVSPADPRVVAGYWATPEGLLYVSTDGGLTWRVEQGVPHGPCWMAACLAFAADGRLLAGTSQGLLSSDDLGRSWHTIREGPHAGVHAAGGPILVHALEEGVLRSMDGVAWEPAGLDADSPVFDFAWHASDPGVLFAATTGHSSAEPRVYRSVGGQWAPYLPPHPG